MNDYIRVGHKPHSLKIVREKDLGKRGKKKHISYYHLNVIYWIIVERTY